MINNLSGYKNRWLNLAVKYIPVIILVVVFWVISNLNLGNTYKQHLIEADGKGYYAYLPAVFIYSDLSFKFYNHIEREKYFNPRNQYEYLRRIDGNIVNKYYAGTALCLAPFFLIGHAITLISGYPADGYSYFYTLFVHLGTLFYIFITLLAIRKLLRLYEISENSIALTLLVLVFGTNLFYYVVVEFTMSHVYSLAFISLFILQLKKHFISGKRSSLLYAFIFLGIIVLIRPINIIIILLIPFIAGSWKDFTTALKQMFLHQKMVLILGMFLFTLIAAIQPAIYHIQTGSFFIYSYPGEHFNFLKPNIIKFLFSFRKGLFIYTPALLVASAGILILYKKLRFEALYLTGFFLFLVYILSSWHMWFYGGSFSQRVMIDFFAIPTLILGVLLDNVKKFRKLLIGLLVIITFVCQIQTYQYRYNQIHWSDMNFEKYWEVFLRVDKL